MELNTVWSLPCGSKGTLESLKVSDLGHVMARFKIEEDGGSRWINYTIGKIEELLSKNKIYNIKSWTHEEPATV